MNKQLQAGVDDALARLPLESRLGVRSIELVPGSEVGDGALAVDVRVSYEKGDSLMLALRSHAWVDGYFEGRGRADSCRSLLCPPDILAIVQPLAIVEKIRADSIVRGVMCYLRNAGVQG